MDLLKSSDASLWEALNDADTEVKISIYRELAERASKSYELKKAAELVRQAASEAKENLESLYVTNLYYLEGRYWDDAGESQEALNAFQSGIDAYVELDPKIELAKAFWGLANTHFRLENYSECQVAAENSVNAALSEEAFTIAGLSQLLLARSLYFQDLEDLALNAAELARSYYRADQNLDGVRNTGDFIGEVLGFLDRDEESISMFEKSLDLAHLSDNPNATAYAQFRLGIALAKGGYHKDAIFNLEESKKISQSLKNEYDVAKCLSNIARSHSQLGNMEEAINSARLSTTIFDSLGYDYDYLGTEASLSALYFRFGKNGEAIRTNQRIIDFVDARNSSDFGEQRAWAILRLADNYLVLDQYQNVLSALELETFWVNGPMSSGKRWFYSLKARALFQLGLREEAFGIAENVLAKITDEEVDYNTTFLYEIKARVGLDENHPQKELHLAHAIALHLAYGNNELARDMATFFQPKFNQRIETELSNNLLTAGEVEQQKDTTFEFGFRA